MTPPPYYKLYCLYINNMGNQSSYHHKMYISIHGLINANHCLCILTSSFYLIHKYFNMFLPICKLCIDSLYRVYWTADHQ